MSKQIKICMDCKQQTDSNMARIRRVDHADPDVLGLFMGWLCDDCVPTYEGDGSSGS